jgi:prolyl oligopeptidase
MASNYPPARRMTLVETIHGVTVPDPYRWLEAAGSSETTAWVDAQNALTRSRLDGPRRDDLVRRLRELYDYPRTLTFIARGGRYFFTHNPGLLDQPILYAQDGADAEPRVLLDPNALSADGTTALTAYEVSPDGTHVAYALSEHGSDRQVIRVIGTIDRLEFVKFASIAWTRDGSGFYYLRFPEPGSVPAEDEPYYGRIYFHRLGDPQSEDGLVFAHPEREVVPIVHVASSGRWVVITAQRGASDDAEVYVAACPPKREARREEVGKPQPLFQGFDAAYEFIDEADGRLFFSTTKDAPMGRIVSIDPSRHEDALREVVTESGDRLSHAVMARDRLVASYLHDASDRLRAFALDGTPRGEIPLPGIGSIVTLDAEPDGDEIRFVFTSFTAPPSAWISRLKPAETSRLQPGAPGDFARAPVMIRIARSSRLQAGDADRYRTTQVWYPTKDGTKISMFLVHRDDVTPDGDRPVLLSGYGGFNISRTPAYDPGNFPFLDAGGVFALANLRGGGEYGEAWHRAGMLEKKQNVFDDFIAAADFLVAGRWTRPSRIAIEGGSNGGLLVGAVMLQRPDLFGAVVCRVPVADMLRYHLFTVGRFWIPEYGSADDPAQFAYLLKYSPYHNIRADVRYPPALVMTADTDDRVDPGMAKKFAARLQADAAGGPFLIRVEMKAGHGAGKPIAKVIDEDADILAFVLDAVSTPR